MNRNGFLIKMLLIAIHHKENLKMKVIFLLIIELTKQIPRRKKPKWRITKYIPTSLIILSLLDLMPQANLTILIQLL